MSDLPEVPLMAHPDITGPVYEILRRAGQGAGVNALAWRCVYAAVEAATRVLADEAPPETHESSPRGPTGGGCDGGSDVAVMEAADDNEAAWENAKVDSPNTERYTIVWLVGSRHAHLLRTGTFTAARDRLAEYRAAKPGAQYRILHTVTTTIEDWVEGDDMSQPDRLREELRTAISGMEGVEVHRDGMLTQQSVAAIVETVAAALARAGLLAAGTPPETPTARVLAERADRRRT